MSQVIRCAFVYKHYKQCDGVAIGEFVGSGNPFCQIHAHLWGMGGQGLENRGSPIVFTSDWTHNYPIPIKEGNK